MPQYSENIMGIDHPALAAKNLEVMVKWYCRCLNYKVLVCKENDGAILVAPDKTFLEIMAANGDSTPERKNKTPGFSHLAIRVHNLKQAVADGKKWGLSLKPTTISRLLGAEACAIFPIRKETFSNLLSDKITGQSEINPASSIRYGEIGTVFCRYHLFSAGVA